MYYLVLTEEHGSYDSAYTEVTDVLYLDKPFTLFELKGEYHTWFEKLLEGLKGKPIKVQKEKLQQSNFSYWLQKKKGFKKVRKDRIEYSDS